MPIVARQRAESALRFLPQKTTWMEPFHVANFRAILIEYVDYLERDDVLAHVVAAVRQHLSRTARDWNDLSLKKNAVEPLPEDPLGAFALRYELIRTAVKYDKFDLRYFVTCLFPGSHMNEKLAQWKRLVVHPFAADLRRLGGLMLERLPSDEWVETDAILPSAIEALAPVAFGPRAWTDADDEAATKAEEAARAEAKRSALAPAAAPATPPVPATASDLAGALERLGRAVESASGLGTDERHDLAVEVRILALEARRRAAGARERLDSRLEGLAAHAALAQPVSEVRRHLAGR